jgi:hypothetical protein
MYPPVKLLHANKIIFTKKKKNKNKATLRTRMVHRHKRRCKNPKMQEVTLRVGQAI